MKEHLPAATQATSKNNDYNDDLDVVVTASADSEPVLYRAHASEHTATQA